MSAGGDKKGAISFVETKAKEFPKGPFRRMLVDVYRDQKDYDRCEAVLNDLRKESPDDPSLAVALVQIVSAQAAEASVLNLPDREKELNNKASTLIRQFETRFPKNLAFLQAECELTARIGDFTRAMDLTREIDKLSPESTMGPMLRTRIFTALNKTREVAQAYSEVLERDPRQLEVRMLLGQAKLKLGEPDEALRQAKFVIDAEGDEPQAILLEARALAMSGNTGTQKKAQYREAVARLEGALASNPKFEEGYHTLAEIISCTQSGPPRSRPGRRISRPSPAMARPRHGWSRSCACGSPRRKDRLPTTSPWPRKSPRKSPTATRPVHSGWRSQSAFRRPANSRPPCAWARMPPKSSSRQWPASITAISS
jgi:hypothetical protein